MNEEPTLPLEPGQRSTAAEMPAARTLWGGFKLLARVGAGGFGEVYRAWDPSLHREVALKLLLPGVEGGEAQYEAMLAEARALAAVQHANVVHVYGIDRHDGRVGFWTDFVKGKTISMLLGEQGPFGYREAALIGMDVTRALSAVHRTGILHRDIKAENVMREEGGRILLMDFGLSTLPTGPMNLAGTPNYMAPELFAGSPATVATDIYAMGVLLYFMVTGAYPAQVTGFTPPEVRAAYSRRRPLMDLRPDLPEAFLRTVSVATDADPARRYASAGLLAEALAESLGAVKAVEQEPAALVGRGQSRREESRREEKERKRARDKERPAWRGWLIAGIVLLTVFWGRVERLFHGGEKAAPAGNVAAGGAASGAATASEYERYEKAQDLLNKSYQSANLAKAVTDFEELLKTDPNFALAQAGLGSAYFIQYRGNKDPKLLEAAESATNRAIQLDAGMAPAYVTLARIAALEDHSAVATQYAQKAMQLDPHSADAHRAMSEVYEAEGRREDAIAEMQKAEDLAPEDWRWPLNLGNYFTAEGKLKEAEAKYERSAELAPENAAAYYDLGYVKKQLNQLDEAKADFERSKKIEDSSGVEQMLGELELAQAKYGDAVATLEKAVTLGQNDYRVWGDLGQAYFLANDHDKATAAYKKAIEAGEAARSKEPKNATLLVLLAYDNAMIGNTLRSLVLLRQALALGGDDVDVSYQAGATYEMLNQREQAMALIAKAVGRGMHVAEFERDPLLAGLRKDPRWESVLAAAKEQKAVDTTAKMN